MLSASAAFLELEASCAKTFLFWFGLKLSLRFEEVDVGVMSKLGFELDTCL